MFENKNDKRQEILIYSRFWPELVDYLDNELGADFKVLPVKTLSDSRIDSCHPFLVIADCYTNEEIEEFSAKFMNAPVFSIGFVTDRLDIVKAFNRNIDLDEFIGHINDFIKNRMDVELMMGNLNNEMKDI